MRRLIHILNFLSPWVTLGLAVALVALYLNPSLLPERAPRAAVTPPRPAPNPPAAIAQPAPAAQVPAASPSAKTVDAVGYADTVARVAPAVVNIATRRVVIERQLPPQLAPLFGDIWPEYRQRVDRSLGSGVIIDAGGHIATNSHVIEGAQAIEVQLADGRVAPAKVVGSDPDTDLALLEISLPHLPVMPLGNSERLRVGDIVLAIGNSLGFGQTVTQGIVSATGRSAGLAVFENFIQTDAAINQGNSGGALVTAGGELVGINTAVLRDETGVRGIEGVGFAIPVNLVRGVTEEIERHGRVVRGWTGLGVATLRPDVVDREGHPVHGVGIVGFYPGSPGPTAGLEPGDVLTRIDGQDIADSQAFYANIARRRPGQKVRLSGINQSRGAFEISLPVIERPRS
jgi:S1-C subfamily serine protease